MKKKELIKLKKELEKFKKEYFSQDSNKNEDFVKSMSIVQDELQITQTIKIIENEIEKQK